MRNSKINPTAPPNCPKSLKIEAIQISLFVDVPDVLVTVFEMPQRRSQNLSLDDLFTFSRAFGRRRKPTTQAEQSSKITDRAAFFDRAALFDHRRRRALISLNVDELRLSSTSQQSSSSELSSSQLSSLS